MNSFGSDENGIKVVIKRGPEYPMSVERDVLETIHHHPCLRPLIDRTEDPSSLVLKYLDDNLLDVSGQKRLEGSDLKFVARSILEALAELHDKSFVHTGKNAYFKSLKLSHSYGCNCTDIKPDNIFVNYGKGSTRFSEVQLGDCGNASFFTPDADPFEQRYAIGAPIFRSPEAMLNLGWGPPTDIWSLGATVRS